MRIRLRGQLSHPSPNIGSLIFRRKSIAAPLIGGFAETQEMLDFCAYNGIVADIEMIAVHDIETAYQRMQKSNVKYRFVIDNAILSDGPAGPSLASQDGPLQSLSKERATRT